MIRTFLSLAFILSHLLLQVNSENYLFNLCSNQCSSATERTIRSAAGSAATWAASADVDGDGNQDIVTSDYNGEIQWWKSDLSTPPAFSAQSPKIADSGSNGVYAFQAIDLNKDTHMDIVAGHADSNTIKYYENDGSQTPQTFTARTVSTDCGDVRHLHVLDIDGDLHFDIVAACFNGNNQGVMWYKNDGNSPPGWTAQQVASFAGGVTVKAGDMDGDGDIDIVASDHNLNRYMLYRNDGASPPQWTAQIVDDVNELNAYYVDIVDFNGDGHLDIIGSSEGNGVKLYLNDGNAIPGFTENEIYSTGMGTAVDIDQDGDYDILLASFKQNSPNSESNNDDGTIYWLENDGAVNPAWTSHTIVTPGAAAGNEQCTAFASDIDGDGDIDIAIASYDLKTVNWYENHQYAPTQVPTVAPSAVPTESPSMHPTHLPTLGSAGVIGTPESLWTDAFTSADLYIGFLVGILSTTAFFQWLNNYEYDGMNSAKVADSAGV